MISEHFPLTKVGVGRPENIVLLDILDFRGLVHPPLDELFRLTGGDLQDFARQLVRPDDRQLHAQPLLQQARVLPIVVLQRLLIVDPLVDPVDSVVVLDGDQLRALQSFQHAQQFGFLDERV